MYHFREYAVAGGLMSYGTNLVHVYRLVSIRAASSRAKSLAPNKGEG